MCLHGSLLLYKELHTEISRLFYINANIAVKKKKEVILEKFYMQ